MRDIAETDWKLFSSQLRPLALERFCQQVLSEVARLAVAEEGSSHDRYIEVYRLIRDRDQELAAVFDSPRRSVALTQIAAIRSRGLITDQEFAGLGQQTREAVEAILHAFEPCDSD